MQFKKYPKGVKLRKTLTEMCDYLGDDYCVINMDYEWVIYRDLGNGYDFEISGLRKTEGEYECRLYVWKVNPKYAWDGNIVETFRLGEMTMEEMKDQLEKIAQRYSALRIDNQTDL